MKDEADALLLRSRKSLDAARLLLNEGFEREAASRSYFAAFYAAEAALIALGEARTKHSGVIAGFHKLVIAEGGFDPHIGQVLRSSFERRNEADYSFVAISASDIEKGLVEVQRFVDAVGAWIKDRFQS